MLPVAVMGPVMGRGISGANQLVQRILNGQLPGYPHLWIPIVAVRDVANAHVLALTAAGAAGERFLIASGPVIAMQQIGALLRTHLGHAALRVPTRSLANAFVRIAAVFSAEFRPVAAELGYLKQVSNEKARRVLGWQPRPSADAINRRCREHDREVPRQGLTRTRKCGG